MNERENRVPIRCKNNRVYGQMHFEGCLSSNCVVQPTKLEMRVYNGEKKEKLVRTEETPYIRPDLTPFLPGAYFSLKPGEACKDLKFFWIENFTHVPRDKAWISCKFSFPNIPYRHFANALQSVFLVAKRKFFVAVSVIDVEDYLTIV